jgi:transposase
VYTRWLAAQPLPAPVQHCVAALTQLRASADQQAIHLRTAVCALARSATYAPVVRALSAQPGVGSLSAVRLVLELGDIARFRSGDALAHYLGLTPSQYSSGELDHRGHILKCGPAALRALLLQCAWAAVRKRGDTDLAAVFERLAPRIGRKRAIVAVARRLAITLRHRWVAGIQSSAPPPAA